MFRDASNLLCLVEKEKIDCKIIDCFVNNKFIYIKTNTEKYKKLQIDQIDNSPYTNEEKLNIELNNNEFIESTFSMIIPEQA